MDAAGPACASCGFNPDAPYGETTCPFSTLYWDFLLRHGLAMEGNPRIAAQLRALGTLTPGDRAMLRQRAMAIRLNGGRRPAATDVRPTA
jgi:deoxyribodipyrimidine photolyase-related protein